MARKTAVERVDANVTPGTVQWDSTPQDNASYVLPSPAIDSLLLSGIITVDDGQVIWREGHLRHIAALFAADEKGTWRDYFFDLTVATQYSKDEFEALVREFRNGS